MLFPEAFPKPSPLRTDCGPAPEVAPTPVGHQLRRETGYDVHSNVLSISLYYTLANGGDDGLTVCVNMHVPKRALSQYEYEMNRLCGGRKKKHNK